MVEFFRPDDAAELFPLLFLADLLGRLNYAKRIRSELDGFLGGKGHHRIVVRYAPKGISVSVTLVKQSAAVAPEVRAAVGAEAGILAELLKAAETQFSQWVYVKRSVRLSDGDTVHLVKPPRRLEWTETQAMLDAEDLISGVIEERALAKA